MPASARRSDPVIDAIRPRSATSATDTSSASSVPTVSTSASIPCGAAARIRSADPSPCATGIAPRSRSTPWLRSDAVATTVAPAIRASCTAMSPTPPEPPWTSTVSPAPAPTACSACAAVVPASIRPAASSSPSAAGRRTSEDGGATTWSAYAAVTG
ncbi:hypothetical protein BC477_01410 [Clavibacter michiganensis subsp. michiganensis]|uniref:Uncharacterized protein n=1 Tax=Clavibacter michiganensis subsp. michiganensis TaxID=33013 RepID=A0A251XIG7_CLAMM|nr:hypothetical protein BC477_01410 [Clavibacter michiganensis subsp. michiganensis]OUE03364.1 hypothetical protein CMMCAS07_00345 [Clavibacter michiganensis subsp. michiganensis]